MSMTKRMIETLKEMIEANETVSDETKMEKSGTCPNCKSDNVGDASSYDNNGVMGPGYSSWKTFDALICNDCGVLFRKVTK